jgi:hypothetical protein
VRPVGIEMRFVRIVSAIRRDVRLAAPLQPREDPRTYPRHDPDARIARAVLARGSRPWCDRGCDRIRALACGLQSPCLHREISRFPPKGPREPSESNLVVSQNATSRQKRTRKLSSPHAGRELRGRVRQRGSDSDQRVAAVRRRKTSSSWCCWRFSGRCAQAAWRTPPVDRQGALGVGVE